MTSTTTQRAANLTRLLDGFSLEMTGKDTGEVAGAAIPAGTRVNVTFLGSEDRDMRLAAARELENHGLVPVPHLSARRLRSHDELAEFLAALNTDRVFAVGGDPATPHGPFPDALSIIESGLLEAHGIRTVSIAGYPEGHPDISDRCLEKALIDKHAAVTGRGLGGEIITQFGFDVDPILDWISGVREKGIDLPVRIGVPGPAGIRKLLRFAARFGVGASASIARKYGLSLTNLMGTAGPDRFLRALATDYHPDRHGEVKLHFYTFGGLRATSEWIADFRKDA